MKKLKSCLIALPIIFLGSLLHAQYKIPKLKDIQEIKDKQLIVLINEPDPELVNKYARKGKINSLNEYKQIMGNYNDDMKSAAQKFWKLNDKEILFMTRADAHAMLKDKSQRYKYIIMYCFSFDATYKRELDWKMEGDGDKIIGTRTYFAIGYLDDVPIYERSVADLIPSGTFISYMVSMLNYNFNYMLTHNMDKYDINTVVLDNAHLLPKKTLLIAASDISPKVINDIGTYYSCSYKVVSDSALEQAVMSGDPAYAYVIRIGTREPVIGGGANDMCWVINCEDGAPLAYTKAGSEYIPETEDQGLRKNFFSDIGADCDAGKKK